MRGEGRVREGSDSSSCAPRLPVREGERGPTRPARAQPRLQARARWSVTAPAESPPRPDGRPPRGGVDGVDDDQYRTGQPRHKTHATRASLGCK
eukprot:scaffold1626_cov372-Prasinococcus_capsulatus_cf.AAC.2